MRAKTIHGVIVPPKKKKVGRHDCVTLDFVLVGAIPSKKNKQLATINRNKIIKACSVASIGGMVPLGDLIRIVTENKPYIRHSKKFKEWEEQAGATILEQAATWHKRLTARGYEVTFPIPSASIKIYHYWMNWIRRDNSNKAETLHDLFVSCGILLDDNWTSLSPNEADADCYEGELIDHITVIQLTAYGWCKRKK